MLNVFMEWFMRSFVRPCTLNRSQPLLDRFADLVQVDLLVVDEHRRRAAHAPLLAAVAVGGESVAIGPLVSRLASLVP